ncbi:MAG TPA: hypothetical protein VFP65_23805 [Anaeromyxobacteraceae bacterium]|nr:hypothetical protein [Anaeromyxobacteraceae bacterium]
MSARSGELAARAILLRAQLAPAEPDPQLAERCATIARLMGAGPTPWELAAADLAADARRIEREVAAERVPVLARWRCRNCSGFVREESAECSRCHDRGPHTYGEDAPTAGNAQRRARLRRDQKRRRRYSR